MVVPGQMRNASDGSAIATRAGDGSTASRPFLSRCSRARASPSRASRPSRDASPRRSRAPPRPSSRPARESWRRSPSARPTPRTRTRRVARTPPPPTSSSPSPPEDVSSTRARSPPSSPRPTFSHPACVHVHPVPASVHFLNRPGVSRGTPHPPARSTLPETGPPDPPITDRLAGDDPRVRSSDRHERLLPPVRRRRANRRGDPPVCHRRVRRVPPRRRRRP